nr:RDD family protein [Rhodococcus sp. HNM0569]
MRRLVAAVVDIALHLAPAVAAMAALDSTGRILGPLAAFAAAFVLPVAVYAAASFIHRVVYQGRTHATIGKQLSGLRLIRTDNGTYPTARFLALWWLKAGVGAAMDAVFSGTASSSEGNTQVVTAVRGCDIDALHAAETLAAGPIRAGETT